MENLWEMIAKARGVAINEVFKWQGSQYKITNYEGLLVLGDEWIKSRSVLSFTSEEGLEIYEDGQWHASSYTHVFIRGEGKIERLPFVPKIGEKYFTYSDGVNAPFIRSHCWSNDYYDKVRKLLGVLFRTEQEAIDYLPTWKKRLEEEESE